MTARWAGGSPQRRLDRRVEAVERRDGNDEYGGKAVTQAVQGVIEEIQPALLGTTPTISG